MGTLYIVSTPIGHLSDISYRAIETLQSVDLILSEDTRRTGILLTRYAIKTAQERYDEYVEERKIPAVLSLLREGKNIALVSSAGTPLISDPGYKLVRSCIQEQILVVSIPGPSSVLTALTVSGLPPDKFLFLGFLPKKEGKRRTILTSVFEMSKNMNMTVILFESPFRIKRTLQELLTIFGKHVPCAVAKELTKIHEEVYRGSLEELSKWAEKPSFKGEYTLIFSLEKEKA